MRRRWGWSLAGLLVLAGGWMAGVAVAEVPQSEPDQVLETSRHIYRRAAAVVSSLVISPDGRLIATAGDDHNIYLWRTSDGQYMRHLEGHKDWVRTLKFSPDGKTLASAGDDRTVRLWNTATGGVIHVLDSQVAPIYAADFDTTGAKLAVAGFHDEARIYDTASGKLLHTVQGPCPELRAVCFSHDGKKLVAAGRNGVVRVWDDQGMKLRDIDTDSRRIFTMAFRGKSGQLAVAGDGPDVHVVDVATGGMITRLAIRPGKIRSLAWCGDEVLAAGSTVNVIHLFKVNDNQEIRRLVGHVGSVATLAYEPTSESLLSSGYDTSIRIWKLNPANEHPLVRTGAVKKKVAPKKSTKLR